MTNAYPHNWTWHLSIVDGSPWQEVRVRKAANLAIDRDVRGLLLLHGLMIRQRASCCRTARGLGIRRST